MSRSLYGSTRDEATDFILRASPGERRRSDSRNRTFAGCVATATHTNIASPSLFTDETFLGVLQLQAPCMAATTARS